MQRRWVRTLLFVLAWIVIALIFSSQLRLLAIINGFQMTWTNIISWELTRWCLWIFLFPLVIRMIRKSSRTSGSRKRFLTTNAATSILISLLHLALFSIVFWFVMRFVDAFLKSTSFFDALFIQLPKTFQAAQFDPHIIFKTIFSIDFHIGILIYWIILAGHQAIEYSRRASELKSQLVRAQLDSLKMQLHPHFLFNTLNSISALVHKNPEAADEMIGELGNFLRLTLQNTSGVEVTLEEELKFLSSYLEIERIRFQNRLMIGMQIEPETLSVRVPNLILQPIIENAIRHGIAYCTEPANLDVSAQKNETHLCLRITNDGPGVSEVHREGIGLSNVRERLSKMYNNDFYFHISGRPEGGAIVEMKIPLRMTNDSGAI